METTPLTDLQAYVNTLVRFGFCLTSAPLSELLYYSNLPDKEYMLDRIDDLWFVHISNGDGTCTWFRFLADGKYDGHGSNV